MLSSYGTSVWNKCELKQWENHMLPAIVDLPERVSNSSSLAAVVGVKACFLFMTCFKLQLGSSLMVTAIILSFHKLEKTAHYKEYIQVTENTY